MSEPTIEQSGPESIDRIQPLWEALNRHHANVSSHFAHRFHANTFDKRRTYLLGKADQGALRVFTACVDDRPAGYCVCSLCDGHGEIESIFVMPDARGAGVGSRLMTAALAWLDDNGAASRSLNVVHGNDTAHPFYARFGFLPSSVVMEG